MSFTIPAAFFEPLDPDGVLEGLWIASTIFRIERAGTYLRQRAERGQRMGLKLLASPWGRKLHELRRRSPN